MRMRIMSVLASICLGLNTKTSFDKWMRPLVHFASGKMTRITLIICIPTICHDIILTIWFDKRGRLFQDFVASFTLWPFSIGQWWLLSSTSLNLEVIVDFWWLFTSFLSQLLAVWGEGSSFSYFLWFLDHNLIHQFDKNNSCPIFLLTIETCLLGIWRLLWASQPLVFMSKGFHPHSWHTQMEIHPSWANLRWSWNCSLFCGIYLVWNMWIYQYID